jgi:hypothetical protein
MLYDDLQATLLNAAAVVLLGSLALIRNPTYHTLVSVLLAGLLFVFILLETLRIA